MSAPAWFYYVARRPTPGGGSEYRPLRGPFDTHKAALAVGEEARARALALDPNAGAYGYGVGRCDAPQGPGILDVIDGAVK